MNDRTNNLRRTWVHFGVYVRRRLLARCRGTMLMRRDNRRVSGLGVNVATLRYLLYLVTLLTYLFTYFLTLPYLQLHVNATPLRLSPVLRLHPK